MILATVDWLKAEAILQGIATVVLTGIAVTIQRQQAKTSRLQADIAKRQAETNRLQYRLALFEKRMAVFNAVVEMINMIAVDAESFNVNSVIKFGGTTAQHPFLFGQEVEDYINALQKKALDLKWINLALRADVGKTDDAAKQEELLKWFRDQIKGAESVFLKYLNFQEP
jgi:hypothetical protein